MSDTVVDGAMNGDPYHYVDELPEVSAADTPIEYQPINMLALADAEKHLELIRIRRLAARLHAERVARTNKATANLASHMKFHTHVAKMLVMIEKHEAACVKIEDAIRQLRILGMEIDADVQ